MLYMLVVRPRYGPHRLYPIYGKDQEEVDKEAAMIVGAFADDAEGWELRPCPHGFHVAIGTDLSCDGNVIISHTK